MTIPTKIDPVLPADIFKALDAHDGGDFEEMVQLANQRVSAALIGYGLLTDDPQPRPWLGRSCLTSLAHIHFAKERALEDLRRFNALHQQPIAEWLKRIATWSSWRDTHPAFGQGRDKRPKWGQPGRGRKRKARVQARAREKEIRCILAEVRGLADGQIIIVPPGSAELAGVSL